MPTTKLKEFLAANGVAHAVIPHPIAFTATSVAGAAHISGKEMAKTVVVNLDGLPALAVVPATRKVDLERLRLATGALTAELAYEREFAADFPECEPGAMPPFGNLYGMRVFVEPHLAVVPITAHHRFISLSALFFTGAVQPRSAAWVSTT